jgi:hypothetical protein
MTEDLRWLGFKLSNDIPDKVPFNADEVYKFMEKIIDDPESNPVQYFPNDYFIYLFKQLNFALSRSTRRVVKHLDNLMLNLKQRQLLYFSMGIFLQQDMQVLQILFKDLKFHEEWKTTAKRIEYELKILEAEFEEEKLMGELRVKYDWERIKNEINEIATHQKKLVYLNNLKFDYLVDCKTASDNIDYLDITYLCDCETERLQILIDIENRYQLEVTEENGMCLNSQYDKDQLINIFKNTLGNKFIKCTEEEFLFWFKGLGVKANKMKWTYRKGGRKNEPNRTALRYYCERLNPDIKPAEINLAFDIQIDSNNKITSAYPDIDILFENLQA